MLPTVEQGGCGTSPRRGEGLGPTAGGRADREEARNHLQEGEGMKKLLPLIALTALALFMTIGTAVANPYTVTGPTLASGGATPFAPGCGGPGEGFHTPTEVPGVNFPNTEVEPWFVANPQDAQNLVGFWQQGRRGLGLQ